MPEDDEDVVDDIILNDGIKKEEGDGQFDNEEHITETYVSHFSIPEYRAGIFLLKRSDHIDFLESYASSKFAHLESFLEKVLVREGTN